MNESNQLLDNNLHVDSDTGMHITAAGKWAKFIAIVIFCCCGIGLIMALAGASLLETVFGQLMPGSSRFPGLGTGVFVMAVFVIVGLLAYVYYLLFDFGQKAPLAVEQDDNIVLEKGLRSLKLYFIISTVLAMLGLLFTLMGLANIFK